MRRLKQLFTTMALGGALFVTSCTTIYYSRYALTPNIPEFPHAAIDTAVESTERQVDEDVLRGWKVVYIPTPESRTVRGTKTIYIGTDGDPTQILKHETVHVILIETGFTGDHHQWMCKKDLCYDSLTCERRCKERK